MTISNNNKKFVIAVVDDDQRVIESLEDLLESAGYAVRAFSSGPALLAGETVSQIDSLITDIGMPGMDGFELERLVGERRPDLPVILITGRHEIAELAEARRKSFFRKPFDGQALLAAVGKALREKETEP